MRVVEAVADFLDVDPLALDPPLGSVLDPDALDALFRTNGPHPVSLRFRYAECHVEVEDGDVVVENRADAGR